MFSAGLTIQAGIEHVFGFKEQVDSNYKHAWESVHEKSTTSTVSYGVTFGTENESTDPNDLDQLGTMGWAIFHVPKITVQDYALYAYDYNVSTGNGTPLGQDMHTSQVSQGDLSYRQVAFELANPGGPNDSIPGLMTGITPLTASTDLTGWKVGYESNSDTNHYTTLLGDSTSGEPAINTITFTDGSNGNVSFSQEIETLTTTGQTSDVDVSSKTSFDFGTKLKGFKADIKLGYDGHFSNSVTNTTNLGTDVEAALGMPSCYESSCIRTLTVQPYLLQATDAEAPWVPTGYNSQLPWAMNWKIVSYTTVGGAESGVSPPPNEASGIVRGTSDDSEEASESGIGSSSYSIKDGKMAWRKRNGRLKPIPMKAREFDPALGVTFKLNGYTWSSAQANGRWSRRGKVWTFTTRRRVKKDVVVLKLDFANRSWDLDLFGADLSPFFRVAERGAHVELNVNGKYEFYYDCDHDVETQWDHRPLDSASQGPGLSLTRYNGFLDASTGIGVAALEGDLPTHLRHFGDMSFLANGRQADVRLRSLRRYARALARGDNLVINRKGLELSLDFGRKKWHVDFYGRIDPHLMPRAAATTLQVKVGGQVWYSDRHMIRDYTSRLEYVNPDPT